MNLKHFAWAGIGLLSAAVCPAQSTPARSHLLGKAAVGAHLAPSEAVAFDVYLPQTHREALATLLTQLHTPGSAQYHQWLTPAQFQARFGADPAAVTAMQKQLSNLGLTVSQSSPHRLHVTGSASNVEAALATELHHATTPAGKLAIVATRALTLPASLGTAGALVADFASTQRMHTDSVRRAEPDNRYSTAGPYWFTDLKQAYDWPAYGVLNGKGTTVAVLISGSYNQADMDAYFSHEGLATPQISVVNILGGAPFDPDNDGSFEAELDVQQAGGMAPKTRIVIYSIPDLYDSSIMAGLTQIVEDNRADVVNMSFSGAEPFYTAAFNDGEDFTYILREENDLFAEGNALGITFVASSGDYGANPIPSLACLEGDGVTPCGTFIPAVGFPASSPHVTAVGGTNLETTYDAANPDDLNSAYVSEEAFGDPLEGDPLYGTAATGAYWASGGGDSIVFKQPAYQKLVQTGNNKVRTVPDVALHMGGCPGFALFCRAGDSADIEAFAGYYYGVIGTSASSPDFAGLTALNVEREGTRQGNENYYLYTLAALQDYGLPYKVFHTGIPGYNGLFTSGNNGYNRVLGNGTLEGKQFLLAPFAPSAGIPQPPTTP